jgi:thiol-disulfide isomerase/thioredoxin
MSLFHARRTREPAPLPDEGPLPGFEAASGWLNGPPLTTADLSGKVVLADFWTYTCVNWLRTLPYVRAWADAYREQGLVVVGVHTPEFPFEREIDNVRQAVQERAIAYPVALDSDYAVWRAFANHYWPAVYIADAGGRIRHHQFGEGRYEECERVIQRLLREAGRDGVGGDLVAVAPVGVEVAADWANLQSPETYLGYEQAERFASSGELVLDGSGTYAVPDRLGRNRWALGGDWTIQGGAGVLDRPQGSIAFRFHARDVNLVLGPPARGASVPFEVRVDGEPPGAAHGVDVDEQGRGTVTWQRLYQLVRVPGAIADRTFEITFLEAGVEAYVFTFG